MARSRGLVVTISGDTKGLKRAFGEAEQSAGRLEAKMHGFGSKIGGAFQLAGAAAAGALVVGLKKSIDAAEEAQVVQKQLAAQLKASGISYRDHAAEIDRVIQKTSELSGLDDEDLTRSFTNIVRVTGNVNKSLKLTGLAADFARAKHLDVAKAGEIVGKVAGGNTGILSRYGITLQKGATATQALGELHKRFAGQAEAYGKTAAGAQDRFGVAVQNLQEKIGGALLPAITKVTNAAAKFINGMQDGTGAGGKFASAMRKVADVVRDVAAAIAKWVHDNRRDLDAIGRAIKTVLEDVVIPTIKRVLPAVKQTFQGVATALKGAVEIISGILTLRFGKVWDGIKDLFRGGLQAAIGQLRANTALMRQAGSMLGGAIVHGLKAAFQGVVGFFRDRVNDLIDIVNAAISAYNKIPLAPNLPKIHPIAKPDHRPSTGAVTAAPHQQGGLIGGTGRGDIVPAMLEPGEFVIRRKVVEKYGPTFFAGLNGNTVPGPAGRFQTGGPVAHAAGGTYSAAQLAALWVKAGGNPAAADMAAAIALAESSGNPNAGRDHPYHGLWQIGPGGPWDPLANAKEAVRKSYNGTNWNAWTTYTGYDTPGHAKTYKQFLGLSGYGTGGAHSAAVPTSRRPGPLLARMRHTLAAVTKRGGARLPKGTVAGAFQPALTSGDPGGLARNMRLFQIGNRINEIDDAIAHGRIHRASTLQRLTGERAQLVDEQAQLLAPPDTTPAAETTPPDTSAADAAQALADEIKALREQIQRQNDFATSVAHVTSLQAVRALADVISGHVTGTGYDPRSMTAGDGSLARY